MNEEQRAKLDELMDNFGYAFAVYTWAVQTDKPLEQVNAYVKVTNARRTALIAFVEAMVKEAKK